MINVQIIGATGMLGSMVLKTIEGSRDVNRDVFDAREPSYHWYKPGDLIINCAGLIKPYCGDIEQAIKVNALFPHTLPMNTIQIVTDCVFSGRRGKYAESDPHDALDVYGKTKSLGEASHIKNLRCSIIGPEQKSHTSLLDWFLAQDKADGYTNHLWNGITTYHFAKIVEGVIREGIDLPPLQHIVPADVVTKAELLRLIAKAYKKKIPITEVEAPEAIDRTLITHNKAMNRKLWKAAGYDKPPTVEQMIVELALLK